MREEELPLVNCVLYIYDGSVIKNGIVNNIANWCRKKLSLNIILNDKSICNLK